MTRPSSQNSRIQAYSVKMHISGQEGHMGYHDNNTIQSIALNFINWITSGLLNSRLNLKTKTIN